MVSLEQLSHKIERAAELTMGDWIRKTSHQFPKEITVFPISEGSAILVAKWEGCKY